MVPDFIFSRRFAVAALTGLIATFTATGASATNEEYQLLARTCSPDIANRCETQTSSEPLANGLNVGGGYAFASGYNGGFALASAVFVPGAPALLHGGVYEQNSLSSMTYSFQVQGAPNTYVPLHMLGAVSVSAIHLSDEHGNPATLVDGATDAPSDLFRIVAAASLQLSLSHGTPFPQNGDSASFEAIYDPAGEIYCNHCGGGGDSFDTVVWVYSNTNINVSLTASTLLRYTAEGIGSNAPIFATVSAETDPVFSIDDPAYSGFTIVGVPTGSPPPGSAGGVPEPASWAMMLAGFGLAGSSIRARRQRVVLAV
jgi:hypothetical protein